MKTGKQHHLSGTRLHRIWVKMRERCSNPKHEAYHRYGGRGLGVCERWNDYENFHADMLPTYRAHLQIDRIDNSRGYSPENCRWVTSKENNNNRRDNIYVDTPLGVMPVAKAAAHWDMPVACLRQRIKKGVPKELLLAPRKRIL